MSNKQLEELTNSQLYRGLNRRFDRYAHRLHKLGYSYCRGCSTDTAYFSRWRNNRCERISAVGLATMPRRVFWHFVQTPQIIKPKR